MSSSNLETIKAQLGDISIIVPTVSRPFAVRRHFEYWRNTSVQVFILDGADEPIELTEQELSTSNVHYLHSGIRFNERLANAGALLRTKYAALVCDDEFFLKEGLRECATYLDEHPDVIGCAGKSLGFFVDQGRFLTFPMYEDWKRFPADANDLRSRLDFALPPNKAHKVQFSLFRSEVWAEIFRESYEHFYSCGYVYERVLNFYAAILGRTELLDSVMWMRSLENPPLSTENVPRSNGRDFVSWGTKPEFAHEVEHFRNKSRQLLARTTQLTEKEIEDYVYRFVDGGIQRQTTKEQNNRKRVLRRVGQFFLNSSPSWAARFAKRFFPRRILKFTGWQGLPLKRTLAQLESADVHVCRESLFEVKRLALETSKSVQ